jgi:hypothetical protein
VLIEIAVHHEAMFGYILIALIVALVPLAYVSGADSRVDDIARRRRYHG